MDYTPVIEAIFKLVLTIISALLIPFIVQKLGNEKTKKLLAYIDIFVAAAEQLFGREETEEKKNYVIESLSILGYKLSDITDDQIEAAVIKLKKFS